VVIAVKSSDDPFATNRELAADFAGVRSEADEALETSAERIPQP